MQNRMRQWIQTAIRCVRDGQGLAEYGLILVLISVASIAILSVLGASITSLYSYVQFVWPV